MAGSTSSGDALTWRTEMRSASSGGIGYTNRGSTKVRGERSQWSCSTIFTTPGDGIIKAYNLTEGEWFKTSSHPDWGDSMVTLTVLS